MALPFSFISYKPWRALALCPYEIFGYNIDFFMPLLPLYIVVIYHISIVTHLIWPGKIILRDFEKLLIYWIYI